MTLIDGLFFTSTKKTFATLASFKIFYYVESRYIETLYIGAQHKMVNGNIYEKVGSRNFQSNEKL